MERLPEMIHCFVPYTNKLMLPVSFPDHSFLLCGTYLGIYLKPAASAMHNSSSPPLPCAELFKEKLTALRKHTFIRDIIAVFLHLSIQCVRGRVRLKKDSRQWKIIPSSNVTVRALIHIHIYAAVCLCMSYIKTYMQSFTSLTRGLWSVNAGHFLLCD